MSSADDRLVGTFMQPPRRTAVLVRGEETALRAEQSFRKLIECLMGAWWIVWKS